MDGSAHISEIRMLRTAPHSHAVNMWHRCLAHLNHQDLRRLLKSSGEHITNIDVEPVTDPMDVESMMDSDIELVMDSDVEPVTEPMDEPVMNPVDKPDKPHWETPTLCLTCVQAKQQQQVICTKVPRSSTLFAFVHSDLCGPMKHSIGGPQYYIIYIDDCTRYTEVYFLITKTVEEILAKFQHY